MSGTLVDPFTQLDQRDVRNRLFQNLPPEWFPDLDDSPNLAGVLDMLATVWTSQQVLQRTLQFDVNSTILFIDGTLPITAGSTLSGIGILGNPVVTQSVTQTIGGTLYQGVIVSALQVLPAGTTLIFNIPDTDMDGIVEMLDYTIAQSRLQTSYGLWLDLFGQDFFGPNLQRHVNETDTSYRTRLQVNVLAPRISRCAVSCGVTNLTGFTPKIIEVRNTGDCGSYTGLANPVWGGLAYNDVGAYGSMELPFQFFIECTRPLGQGIPNVSGYGMSGAGYATLPLPYGYVGAQFPPDTGTGEYVTLADLENNLGVTDADIYALVADRVAAGVTAWTNISSNIESEIRATGLLDVSFYLDMTCLAPDDTAAPGQVRVIATINIVPAVELVFSAMAISGMISIGSDVTVNNPINVAVAGTIQIMSSVAIDTMFMEVAASLPSISGAVTLQAAGFHSILATIPIVSDVVMQSSMAMHVIAPIKIAASIGLQQMYGVSIGAITTDIYMVNGTLTVDYISVDFNLDSSLLTPAGGRLGQTLVLGTSKIGIDYGY